MKRIRTWAWPEPNDIHQQLNRSSWGGAYWKQTFLRKQKAEAAASMRRMMLLPLVHAQVSAEAPAETAPVRPVVH